MESIEFSAIFAAAPGPYLLLAPDRDYTILAVNDAYLAATLTTRGRLVGRAMFDAFPDNPSDPAATGVRNLRASLDAVVRDLKPHRMAIQKYDIRRPDGTFEERHWSPINTPVLAGDGQTLTCIIHHVEDVTEFVRLKQSELALGQYAVTAGEKLRVSEQRLLESSWRLAEFEERLRAEAALRHSRAQMEIVVNGANVGVWYCPLPFDELIWDEKVKEHFHLPPDTKVTIETFYERLHPDDRERTRSSIETSIASKQPYDIDYRTVSPDGRHVKWIRASGRGFYDDAGNPIRFDGITIDTTDRVRAEHALRESESRFRQLADAVPQMVWVTRPDGFHE
jgi:PAS domain-containing protein